MLNASQVGEMGNCLLAHKKRRAMRCGSPSQKIEKNRRKNVYGHSRCPFTQSNRKISSHFRHNKLD